MPVSPARFFLRRRTLGEAGRTFFPRSERSFSSMMRHVRILRAGGLFGPDILLFLRVNNRMKATLPFGCFLFR
ncbi:hypothetical protein B9L21_16720 [Geobacillus uzenensis]|uniref:Uncharacterized protein n=1 Tax=Geobacillus uzenensis TaxID=129339 RepID=A0ABX4DE86_9BACL|nr:hypothetical protein A5418_11755 [Geobacillus subterraneus]OXB85301.1 hypothetical protein B9L21_16720 [Geobacillus uzenensis]